MQINRLFQMVYILLDKKTVTAKDLAEEFEVSTRTIYRDVDTLSSAGIPIFTNKGKGGGISLLPDFVLNKAVLSEKEKSDILTSLKAVSAVQLKENDGALKKLKGLFGRPGIDWIEVDFSSWYDSRTESELFQSLKTAILGRKTVAFHYANAKGAQDLRKVEPLKLCFKGSAWYLYGYCKKRKDDRFFKLRRMKKLEISEENFMRNSPDTVLSQLEVSDAEFITLKLKLSKEMAFRVYEELDHYQQQKDGSFVGELRYPMGEWIFPYIASFGEFCEVLEPEEVRVEMQNKLKEILKKYL